MASKKKTDWVETGESLLFLLGFGLAAVAFPYVAAHYFHAPTWATFMFVIVSIRQFFLSRGLRDLLEEEEDA